MQWTSEAIPDEHHLYRRVHANDFRPSGELNPGAFREDRMSCDWCKYRTPKETQRGGPQDPRKYAVGKLKVGKVREIPNQQVQHTPDASGNNRAHTDVVGKKKDPEIRLRFFKIFCEVIPLSSEG